jgi:hypothetical protein
MNHKVTADGTLATLWYRELGNPYACVPPSEEHKGIAIEVTVRSSYGCLDRTVAPRRALAYLISVIIVR